MDCTSLGVINECFQENKREGKKIVKRKTNAVFLISFAIKSKIMFSLLWQNTKKMHTPHSIKLHLFKRLIELQLARCNVQFFFHHLFLWLISSFLVANATFFCCTMHIKKWRRLNICLCIRNNCLRFRCLAISDTLLGIDSTKFFFRIPNFSFI